MAQAKVSRVELPTGEKREHPPSQSAASSSSKQPRVPPPQGTKRAASKELTRDDMEDELTCLNCIESHDDVIGDLCQLVQVHDPMATKASVAEFFCPGKFASRTGLLGLPDGIAFDLRTGWDLDKQADQKAAWKWVKQRKPYLIIGSPMCGPFSVLQAMNDIHSQAYNLQLRKALRHLRFCLELYRYQVRMGRKFLHEHPQTATSWKLPMVQEFLKMDGVRVELGDQCVFGQTTTNDDKKVTLAMKPTNWMSNDDHILAAVGRKCPNRSCPKDSPVHVHQPLVGGRAKATESYPERLCIAVLKALRQSMRSVGLLGAMEVGYHVDEPDLSFEIQRYREEQNEDKPLFAMETGYHVDEPDVSVEVEKHYDDITGALLEPTLVRKARAEEVEFLERLGTWRDATEEECIRVTGKPPIPSRWVDINKGDQARKEYRSRLTVKELKAKYPMDAAEVFAATPPVECLRLLASLTMCAPAEEEIVMGFIDISRAHPHADLNRTVYIWTPVDCGGKSRVKLLHMTLYGLRDAPQNFEFKVKEVMEALNFVQGLFSPCLWFKQCPKYGSIRVMVHGDDFIISGTRAAINWLHEGIGKKLISKLGGIIGPDKSQGDIQEIVILNRIMTWIPAEGQTPDCLTVEADSRHSELIRDHLNLQKKDAKGLTAPGEKRKLDEDVSEQEAMPLGSNQATDYRSIAMRGAYLSEDRPDIRYACKELARRMQKPTEQDWIHLKHLGRYLIHAPRLQQRMYRQALPRKLTSYADSDHAGCKTSRKSTSSSVLMFGDHMIKLSSTTQGVLSLSSAEAEWFAMVKTSCMSIGTQSACKDLGISVGIDLHTDSSAAKGIGSRRGVGKVRHLDVNTLWLQQKISSKQIKLYKVGTHDNPADLGTKHLDSSTIVKFINKLGFCYLAGKSSLGLSTT